MRSTSKCSIKKLSWFDLMTFFFRFDDKYKHFSCYNISFSFRHCSLYISRIINFFFICTTQKFLFNNDRINSIIFSMIFSSYVVSISWICFRAIISSIDRKIVALLNIMIFHSLMITSDFVSWTFWYFEDESCW